jgi:hypothetical protein
MSHSIKTPVTSHPDALVVRAHCAASDLTNPDAAIYADPRDMLRSGDLVELHISCDFCSSRELIEPGWDLVITVTGHEDSCPVWMHLLTVLAAA